MKKKVTFLMVALGILTLSHLGNAAKINLHVIDNSGSMTASFDADNTFSDVAKTRAKAKVGKPLGQTELNALYTFRDSDFDMISDFVPPADAHLLTDDNGLIDSIENVAGHSTNLADAICLGMHELSLKDASVGGDNDLYLYIYTDGWENNSSTSICAAIEEDDGWHINGYDFTPNALEAADEDDKVVEIEDQDERWWAETGTQLTLPFTWKSDRWSRTYEYYKGPAFNADWAGGVEPMSWEWRSYYRVTWGDFWSNLSHPYNYKEWKDNADFESSYKPEEGEDPNVVINIDSLYELIEEDEDLTAMAALGGGSDDVREDGHKMIAVVVRDDGALSNIDYQKAAPAPIPLRTDAFAASRATITYSSLQSTEDSLFAGLTTLTGGTYTRIPNNAPVPLLGDLDGDQDVDEDDMRIVLAWFGRPVDYYAPQSVESDLQKDEFIDNADINVIRSNWTDMNKYPPIVGDMDYNWCVDNGDLSKIWQWFGKTPGPGDQAFYHADLNVDGKVNWADYFTLMAHWQEGCGTNGIPTCYDGIQYGEETDIDCGGSICNGCGDGQSCIINDDCLSNVCDESLCVGGGTPPTGIDLGPINSETQFSVNGSQDLYIDQLSFTGWTPSNIVVGFGDTNGLSLNGITVSVDGGTPIYLSGYWQTISIPFTNQSLINITVNSATPRALRAQWWAN